MVQQPADAPAAKPYGLLGLALSLAAILAAALAICLVVAAIAGLVAVAVLGWSPLVQRVHAIGPSTFDAMARERLGIVVSLVAYAALSVAVLAAARLRGGRGWRGLIAWRPWNSVRGAAPVWGLAVLLLVYSLGADAALSHLKPSFNPIHSPSGPGWAVLFVLLAALFAPVAEELVFRGWIYTSLRASFGVGLAILVVSVLFALAHWEETHLYAAAVFPVGLGLAWIRERTGSIAASICVHALYNGVASMLLLFGT